MLAVLLLDDKFGSVVAGQVRPEHFDGAYRPAASAALDYHRRYGRSPGAAHAEGVVLGAAGPAAQVGTLKKLLGRLRDTAPGINAEYVAHRAEEFVRGQVLRAAIVAAGERMVGGDEDGRVADVEAILTKAMGSPKAAASGRIAACGLPDFCHRPYAEPAVLLAPWLARGEVTICHAPPGHLKSMLAVELLWALTWGIPALGDRWTPNGPTRGLYVDGEMNPGQLKRRLQRLPIPRGLLSARRAADGFHTLSVRAARQEGVEISSLYSREGRAALDREMAAIRPAVVVLDSIFTLFGGVGQERELERWAKVTEWLRTWQDRGVAFVILHHNPKASNTPYGTVARMAFADVQMSISLAKDAPKEDDEKAIEIAFSKHREFGEADARPFWAFFAVRDDRYHWRSEEITEGGGETKSARVGEMLGQGYEPKAIMEETGASKGLVSQVKRKMAEKEVADGAEEGGADDG